MSTNPCSSCGSPPAPAALHRQMAAIWFPPYANPGAQPPAAHSAAAKAEATTFAAVLKGHEDKVLELIGNLSDAERAIAYKYLHASGMRIGSVDADLCKAIRSEIANAG